MKNNLLAISFIIIWITTSSGYLFYSIISNNTLDIIDFISVFLIFPLISLLISYFIIKRTRKGDDKEL